MLWPRLAAAAYLAAGGVSALDRPCPAGTAATERWHGRGSEIVCLTPAGVRHGPFVILGRDRVIVGRGEYHEGGLTGSWQNWYDNHSKWEEGHYEAGQRSGEWTSWHSNGQKKEEGTYRKGYESGVWRTWDEQGRLVSTVPRDVECPAPLQWQARGPSLNLHPEWVGIEDGRACERSDGVLQGPAMAWRSHPRRLVLVGFYCDGDAQGRWSFFGNNGVLAREGWFAALSRKHGIWKDWDEAGRPLREIEYLDGKEVARRELARPVPVPNFAPDPADVDAVVFERYHEALGRSCSAQPGAPRPYRGLREELRSADAVLRVTITERRTLDPPPGMGRRWELKALVDKVLGGSGARRGEPLTVLHDAADHQARWTHQLPRMFAFGPQEDAIVLVKRDGDRWLLLAAIHPDDRLRTDELLAHYDGLARSDDTTFGLGLARLLAALVRSDPDRLLWMGWIPVAFDDWSRLQTPPAGAAFEVVVVDAHRTVVKQVNSVAGGGQDWLNLHDLPWLIRFLPEPQRRDLARALLRLHVVAQRELGESQKPLHQEHTEPPHPLRELSWEQVRAMSAYTGMRAVIQCLALCIDPRLQAEPPVDTLDRARAFVAGR